jgi:hypothetical protein
LKDVGVEPGLEVLGDVQRGHRPSVGSDAGP